MNELIKVTYDNDRPAVSARELHEFLEVGTRFNDWFPRMCEYGFSEGQDFYSILSESTGGRPAQDAALSIDMAKEICMLQRNEKGKIARQYFLQLEKDWNSPEKVMASALRIADKRLKMLEEAVEYIPKNCNTCRYWYDGGCVAPLELFGGCDFGVRQAWQWRGPTHPDRERVKTA